MTVSHYNTVKVQNERRAKQQIVIKTIRKHMSPTSEHEICRQIHQAVANGSKLSCEILTHGGTNYSYKVTVENTSLCIFAKLSLEYALWNPSKYYYLGRTENEFMVMKYASNVVPDSVVKPLGCWDVNQGGQHMKLLVTEWSAASELFSNQFVNGVVDPRIAPKLAVTLASLHNMEFDPEFNAGVKDSMENKMEIMKAYVKKVCASTNPVSRTEKYCVEVGFGILGKVLNGIVGNYHLRECLIHSDSHPFNILTEAKPSAESFGPNGEMILCDWEQAMAGPVGRDVGLALAFPIACYIAHALKGRIVGSIREYIDTLVDNYLSKMEKVGMRGHNRVSLYRNIMGWCGWLQFLPLHMMKARDTFTGNDSEADLTFVRDALGVLGLKLMRFSMDDDLISKSATFDEVRNIFQEMLDEEISNACKAFAYENCHSHHANTDEFYPELWSN